MPIPPLDTYRRLYEQMLAPLHPGKVVAISLNTLGLDDTEARAAIAAASRETGLPAADPVRHPDGIRVLADAVLTAMRAAGRTPPTTGKAKAKAKAKAAAKPRR